MDLSTPEHDAIVGIAVRTHYGAALATTDEQRAAMHGAGNVLRDVLTRVDGLRYITEPGLGCTYVTDRWTGQTVDLHYEARGAELIANRRNSTNIADGRAHLAAAIGAGRDNLRAQPAAEVA